MVDPSSAPEAPPGEGPGVVIINWAPSNAGLLDALDRALQPAGVGRITCVVSERGEDEGEALPAVPPGALERRRLAMPMRSSFVELVEWMRVRLNVAQARAVIVLPHLDESEPDSISRRTCAALRRACAGAVPNVLVEVEDPEAAFEFVGLGVATVFYSGHLRAALLGQACIDLGVFQFILGLLRGRQRIQTIAVPEALRQASFAEAALELELDEFGQPMTIIGVARPPELGQGIKGSGVHINPGPSTPLRDVLGLVALVSAPAPSPRTRP